MEAAPSRQLKLAALGLLAMTAVLVAAMLALLL